MRKGSAVFGTCSGGCRIVVFSILRGTVLWIVGRILFAVIATGIACCCSVASGSSCRLRVCLTFAAARLISVRLKRRILGALYCAHLSITS